MKIPVSNKAPIFHSARSKVGNGNHVLLGKRVGDVEIVNEEVRDVAPNF